MDNRGAHEAAGVREANGAAAGLLYWAPYGQGLNPIEQVFAKLTTLLSTAAASAASPVALAAEGHPMLPDRPRQTAGDPRATRSRYESPRPCGLRILLERAFCRLGNQRRIATRDDELTRNDATAVALADVVTHRASGLNGR